MAYEAIVEHHTRKGIRKGCLCTYCESKKSMTSFVGNVSCDVYYTFINALTFETQRGYYRSPSREFVDGKRIDRRRIARKLLELTKEDIL